MKPARWLLTTFAAFLLLAFAAIAINVSVDIYGIFRDTKNRHLIDYGDDRIAKYLLSEHYVPQNFDAILVGPSVSANWDLHAIRTMRVYNESMNGSNFVEEECLVRNAVANPGLKVALLLMHPSMTAAHAFNTVQLTEHENLGALGSISLFQAYKDWFARRRHPENVVTDDYGTDFFADPVHLNAIAARMLRPGADFDIDGLALDAYKEVLGELQSHHVKVVLIFPPTYVALFGPKRDAFCRYKLLVINQLRERPLVIDFSETRFESFWCDRLNFSDGVHISRSGTRKIVALLDNELAALRSRGLL